MVPHLKSQPEQTGTALSGLKYHILGTVQQTVVLDLDASHNVYSDTGAMSWMSENVDMQTRANGGMGGVLKRMFSGATAFLLNFEVKGPVGQVAFCADFPGQILPMELETGQSIVLHKHAFICAESTVDLDIFFNQRLFAGLFGGEGFILQKLTGPGLAFAELDGDAVEYHLKPGETLKVEPGHVAMFDATIEFNVTRIRGITNMLFSGEGIFLATLKGPGRVWLHSMSASKLAHRIGEYLPSKSS